MPASWRHHNKFNKKILPGGLCAAGKGFSVGKKMSEHSSEVGQRGPSHRWTEFGVGVFCILFGVITIIGSIKAGAGWGPDGPKSGFFPFYVGLIIVLASCVNCIQLLMERDDGQLFADWGQLRQVLSVFVDHHLLLEHSVYRHLRRLGPSHCPVHEVAWPISVDHDCGRRAGHAIRGVSVL